MTIQPLYQILTEVVGVDHYPGKDNISFKNTELVLWRDPLNEEDPNAIQVRSLEGDMVGHLRKELAAALSQLLKNDVIQINHLIVYTLPQQRNFFMSGLKIKINIYGFEDNKPEISQKLEENRFIDASTPRAKTQFSRKKRRIDGSIEVYHLQDKFSSKDDMSSPAPVNLDVGSRVLLYSLLLMKNYRVREDDKQWISILEELRKALRLPNSGNNFRVRPLNEYLTASTDGVITFLSKRERNLVVQSVDSPEYGGIFLMKADKNAVIEYCRTSQYPQKHGEIILRIDVKFNQDLIDRLGLEILDHPTIEDSSIHQTISEKLRIPLEILSLGREGYRRFVDLLRKGESEICHASVMILGCGGVGKTTLLKRLTTTESIAKIRESTKSTQSVDIHQTDANTLLALPSQYHERMKIDVSTILQTDKQPGTKASPKKRKLITRTSSRENKRDRKMSIVRDIDYSQDQKLESNMSTDDDYTENKILQGTQDAKCTQSTSECSTKVAEDMQEEENIELKSKAFLQLVPVRREGEVYQCIDFYDFAGQYVYYSTHQIYLRRCAIYILVTDMRKGWSEKAELEDDRGDMMFRGWTNETFLNFWLDSIQAFSGGSKPAIILVGTHAEEKSEEEKSEYFIYLRSKVKAKKLLDMLSYDREYAVSFESNDNVDDIKECIKTIVKEHENWKRIVPNVWALFQQKLKEMMPSHKLMKFEDLLELQVSFPEDMRLEREDLKFMLKFFHEIGFILYFDITDLQDFFVLDVNFFKDAFKCIITVKSNVIPKVTRSFHKLWIAFQERGELPHPLVNAIWNDKMNPPFNKHKKELILYMKELCLLTEVRNKNTENGSLLIVPCMNTVQFSPETFKNYQKTSIFCVQLPALANQIFQRLATVCANKLWPILIKRESLCIYQNAVIFDYCNRLIAVGSMHDTIQIQLLSYDEGNTNTAVNIEVKDAILSKLGDIAKTIHCSFSFVCGYKCKNASFCDETNSCFIPENDIDYTKEYITCETCPVEENTRINVMELVSHWKKIDDEDSSIINKEDTVLLFDFVSGKLCKESDLLCTDLIGDMDYANALSTQSTLSPEEKVFKILKKWKEMKPAINHIEELKKHLIEIYENTQVVDDIEHFSKEKYSYQCLVKPWELITLSECALIVRCITRRRNSLLRFLGLKECERERIEEEVRNPQETLSRSLNLLLGEKVLNRQNLCAALNYIGRVDIIEKLRLGWKM